MCENEKLLFKFRVDLHFISVYYRLYGTITNHFKLDLVISGHHKDLDR